MYGERSITQQAARRRSDLLFLVFLATAVLAGFGLRFALSAAKMVLEYDDAISLLVATGHEGEYAEIAYQNQYPLGEWVPASEWKRMLESEPGRGLAVVALDLAKYDIHPPLYFWLLSLWVRLTGSSLLSLHLLNLVIDALVALTLFWIGRREWGSSQAGLLLAAAWSLTPIALKTTPWVRQYILFALAALLFAYLLFNFLRHSRRPGKLRRALALLAVMVSGLLVHYYFSLLILVGFVLVAARLYTHPVARRAALALALSVGLAGLAFLALNPGMSASVATYAAYKLEPLGHMDLLVQALWSIIKTNLLLFTPALWGLALAWLAGRADRPVRGVHRLRQYLRAHQLSSWMLAFSLAAALLIATLFMAGIGPRHTMSSRYLGYLAPLAAFIPIPALLGSPRRWVQPLFIAALLLLGAAALHPSLAQAQEGDFDRASLRAAPAVVIDSMEWGTWPMAAQHLRPDQQVYVAHSSNLAADPSAWIDGLAQGGVYVSILRGNENTAAGRAAVLETLRERYTVERLSRVKRPGDWEVTLFAVRP